MPSTKSRKNSESSTPKSSSQEKILKKRGYTLGKLLGEGSYAKVYLAEYEDTKAGKKQKLACKLINGGLAPKDFLRKFFPREVEIMSKCVHQYIIRVHSILQRKQKYYIFMQYAENGDMLEFIRTNGPIKERQARIWFGQILKGLKYLHDQNIAHRDMKCENLLLTAAYNIKITDFGFARYTVDADGKPVKSDTFCGSVSYAPPEIIKGSMYDCKKADLWSLGVVLYIMLNKAMPFDDSNLKKLYEAQMTKGWRIRTKLKEILSEDVKRFLLMLLEPYPAKRKPVDELWLDPWVQAQPSTHDIATSTTRTSAPAAETAKSAEKVVDLSGTRDLEKPSELPVGMTQSVEVHGSELGAETLKPAAEKHHIPETEQVTAIPGVQEVSESAVEVIPRHPLPSDSVMGPGGAQTVGHRNTFIRQIQEPVESSIAPSVLSTKDVASQTWLD